MYNLKNTIIDLYEKLRNYKWLLIPFIPASFFIILLVYLFIPQETKPPITEEEIQVTPAQYKSHEQIREPRISQQVISEEPSPIGPDETVQLDSETFPNDDYYGDYDPSGMQGIQKVENLNDGTQKYTVTSSSPTRQNIIITRNNRTIYQRSIPSRNADIPLQNIIELSGQPERVISGPAFYGPNTSEYIFAQKGLAVVVNNQTNQVIEHHFFQPTTVDNYIQNFGNDGSPLRN